MPRPSRAELLVQKAAENKAAEAQARKLAIAKTDTKKKRPPDNDLAPAQPTLALGDPTRSYIQQLKLPLLGRFFNNPTSALRRFTQSSPIPYLRTSPPAISQVTVSPSKPMSTSLERPAPTLPTPNPFLSLVSQKPALLQQQAAYTSNRESFPGIANLGNTCYINSVLQCLSGLERWIDEISLFRRDEATFSDATPFHRPLLSNYLKFLQDCQSAAVVRPTYLRSALAEAAPAFAGSRQQDAHEFLSTLLGQIESELGDCHDKDAVARQFNCQVEHELTCASCGHCRVIKEDFRGFSLELPPQAAGAPPPSVTELLRAFFHRDEVEYACEQCPGQQTVITHRISAAPACLMLHLKRFEYTATAKKLSRPVLTDRKLQMSDFGNAADQDYQLAGVVLHQGESLGTGHYTAHVKRAGDWFLFNDSMVRQSEPALEMTQSYLLFYVRGS